jgi:acetylornithine deacetylase/succinyl-diaminopimelate desuccinylase-like protein
MMNDCVRGMQAHFEKYKTDGSLGQMDQFGGMEGTLCVIGIHSGGDKIYVPERAEVTIDRHILPGETVDSAAAQIRAMVDSAGVSCEYELTWDDRPTPAPPAFITDPGSHFVQTAKCSLERALGEPVGLALARSVADTNHLAAHGGGIQGRGRRTAAEVALGRPPLPTIILGPTGGNTCAANEWVDTASLLPCARAILETVLTMMSVDAVRASL